MRNFLPIIIADGCILGFTSASASHFIPKDQYEKINVCIFLVFLGFGAIIGGYLSGLFTDKFPIIKVGKSSFFVLGSCIFLSLPIFMGLISHLFYCYFLAFTWGFGWHYLDGWLWVSCSKVFGGKLEAFALNKFVHSFSFVLYQVALIIHGADGILEFIEYFFLVLIGLMIVSLICLIR